MYLIPISSLNATTWSLTGLACVLTAGRFYLQYREHRLFSAADIFNLLAAVCLIVYAITYHFLLIIIYETREYELGISPELPSTAALGLRLQIANILLFFLVVYAVKASFLALYWQIFRVSTRFRIAWWVVSVYMVVAFLISVLSSFWSCGSPTDTASMEACHDPEKTKNAFNILVLWCVLNALGDLLVMILPMAMLNQIPLRLLQKLGLAFVFSLVLVSVALNILRTLYTSAIRPELMDQNLIWSILEPTIAVIICALPYYRVLLSWEAIMAIKGGFTKLTGSFRRGNRVEGESILVRFNSPK